MTPASTPQRSSVRPDRLILASLLVAGLAAGCGGDEKVLQVFGAFDGPSRVDFGEVAVLADTPVSRVIEIGNKGSFPLEVTALGLQGDDPAAFAVVGVDGPLALPFTVDPGKTVTVIVEFTPTSPRRYEADVVVQANLPSPARIVLSGVGLNLTCAACDAPVAPVCDGDTLVRVTLGSSCPGRDLCVQTEARTPCAQGCDSQLVRCTECGNGILDPGEVCDGAAHGSATCSSVAELSMGALRGNEDCGGFDTSRCKECGNGVIEADEICDGAQFEDDATCVDRGFSTGTLGCVACTSIDDSECSRCGDGQISGAEVCDGADVAGGTCDAATNGVRPEGTVSCQNDCLALDATGCSACGNGVREAAELCDGTDVAGTTCQSLGSGDQGTVVCNADCAGFDDSGCSTCGNGSIDGNEACDGTLVGARTCLSETGRASGTLTCNVDCRGVSTAGCYACGDSLLHGPEVCDGTNLDGASCTFRTPSYASGQLACAASCLGFDGAGCFTCGNGQVEGPELCDGAAFGTATCSSESSFTDGALTCATSCMAIDAAGCHTCGNNSVEGPEACDGTQLGASTCTTELGLSSGAVSCDATCLNIDVTACYQCGNNLVEGPEVCDGTNFGGQDCQSAAGLSTGSLSCDPLCGQLDTTACYQCGNATVEGPEVCDGINLNGQFCSSQGRPGGLLACAATCTGYDLSGCSSCGDGLCEINKGENISSCQADCGYVSIYAYVNGACGTRASGELWCWGLGAPGRRTGGIGLLPSAEPGLPAVRSFFSDYYAACAVAASNGQLYCWGENSKGVVGNGTNTAVNSPYLVPGLTGLRDVDGGFEHTCIVDGVGAVRCWGSDANGELGDIGRNDRTSPGPTVTINSNVSAVSSSLRFSCALTQGQIWCWGLGTSGQLGNGFGLSSEVPVQVLGLSDAVAIATGAAYACALDSSGDAWCWGGNGSGALGNGSTSALQPIRVTALTGLTHITAGAAFGSQTCALRGSDGTAWCWGQDLKDPLILSHLST